MFRLALRFLTCCFAVLVYGCAPNRSIPPGDNTGPPPISLAQMLPGLPDSPVGRSAAEAGSHVFVEADEISSQGAIWTGDVLSLELAGFSYSIIGFNLGTSAPVNIGVGGTLNGMWLAVSDYGTGGWHFLGGVHNAPQVHDLTGGNYQSPTGWIYFALVCPDGASADVTTTLDYETPPQTDFEPPVWQGGMGIKSLDTNYFHVTIEWYPAVDTESPPVTYLIYWAEKSTGINWDNPQLTVSAGFTSTSFFIDENPVLRDYGVRARDALGNMTDNTNFMFGSIPWTTSYPIFDWVPGDKVLMTWDDQPWTAN